MPNKETKKFEEVIKKRRNRVMRLKRNKELEASNKKFKWVPAPIVVKESWWKRLLKFLHLK
jgi:hypothetical protein